MELIVHGGHKLSGTVKIDGGKNVALPIMAATILAEGKTTITNVPALTDVFIMSEILKSLNLNVDFNDFNVLTVKTAEILTTDATDLAMQIRASILVVGPLLGRCGKAKVRLPGGCAIGERPINLHLEGLRALGASVMVKNGYVEAFADRLVGNNICLDYPSVGATENLMMAGVRAVGVTVIENAAMEPEIEELAKFLNKMGARVTGAGSDVICIEGVNKLQGVRFPIIQDRHEAGTFMIAASMTQGDILIQNATPEDNHQLISKLIKMGALIREEKNGIRVIGPKKIEPTTVVTKPHPGFPTDMQSPLSAMMAIARGLSTITETVYEKRYQHFRELIKMGVDFTIEGNSVVIKGGRLRGAAVAATDLRAAAALVLAGLAADGVTRVSGLKYLDRGYCRFHEKLQKLGAKIERV